MSQRKEKYINKDISSLSEVPIVKTIGDFIDVENKVNSKNITVEIDEKNIFYYLNSTDQTILDNINTLQKDQKGFYQGTDISKTPVNLRYQNFNFFLPNDQIESDYFYEVKNIRNENLYNNFIDKISVLDITSTSQIKNFYTFPIAKDQKNFVEEYYKNNLSVPSSDVEKTYYKTYNPESIYSPSSNALESDTYLTENEEKYSFDSLSKKIFLFANETIQNSEKELNIDALPEYNLIKIPAIRGLTNESVVSDILDFMKYKSTYANSVDAEDVYKFIFYNYFLNKDKRYNNSSFTFTNSEQSFNALPYSAILSDDKDFSVIKQNKEIYIDPENYSKKTLPNFNSINSYIQRAFTKDVLYKNLVEKKENTLVPFFYKIQKFNVKKNEPEQEIYIPITGREGIEYIDNQIFPTEKYKYSVSILFLSIGFNYKIKYVGRKNDNEYVFKFQINLQDIEFNPHFFEINIFKDLEARENKVLPCIPEANITSIFGDPHNIKIFLSTKISQEKFIFFSDIEKPEKDSDVYENKLYNFSNPYLNKFFIYRLERRPSSYQDFVSSRIKMVSSKQREFFDFLDSNTKYYYTFRSFDGRNFSNPSEVYEVELKNFNGTIVPSIKTINFTEVKEKEIISTSFNKRVTVFPSAYQMILPENQQKVSYKDASDNSFSFDRSFFLDLQSVFNNTPSAPKYKIRIKSKKTGKMVDININYRYAVENLIGQKK